MHKAVRVVKRECCSYSRLSRNQFHSLDKIVLENPAIARGIEIQILVTTLPCNLQLLSASWRIGGKKKKPRSGLHEILLRLYS